MLPWILLATMSFATALAVMKDPWVFVSERFWLQDGLQTRHTDRVDFQHALKVRYRVVE